MRLILASLMLVLVITIMNPLKWCGCDDAQGQTPLQIPLLPRSTPLMPRDLTNYDHIQSGYQHLIERLFTGLYEGYLTRPGFEKEEEAKFVRGLRLARIAQARAMWMISKEPWEIVKEIPPLPTRRQLEEERTP